MKTVSILLLLTLFLNTRAQDFKSHILFLASDSLYGRAPATVYEKKAAAYIKAIFDSSGCYSIAQMFPFQNDSAVNVIALKNLNKDSTVIIAAHYDHLGYGSKKSLEIVRKGIHPGADDNASGVALMLELAKWISVQKNWHYNFVFAAYSAHEAGLFGSHYFSKSALADSMKIKAVINFDMVGRLDESSKTMRISGADTDSLFKKFFLQQQDSIIHFGFDDANILHSDLKPFAPKGIPVLNFTTGIHDDYHRVSDTESKINYIGMSAIYHTLQMLLRQVF